ncbi:uncharacterized protein LOC118459909 isoform X2 [Anopheles albimanus]|uniref:Ig-like domain-containing protein n=1 Tax=Anopheles albimanus TaxID=7167 RepID=A0A3F2YPQ2_ANOAL|nr:uncharacterized protein LOC118459909 isoform X2 [Anopheles albimanus]
MQCINRATGGGARKRDLNNLYQVIYYGDSQVEVGKPFSISCIISIANPVDWHKDGEPIRKRASNIRHGKDEHSYIESEMGIAGNRDKIEASISVQRALPKHQGKYQCNALYKNYHQLYVLRNGSLLGSSSHGGERKHEQDQPAIVAPFPMSTAHGGSGTVRSTLMAPLSIEHHHFTTAVALAPGPIDRQEEEEEEIAVVAPQPPPPQSKTGHSPHHHRQQAANSPSGAGMVNERGGTGGGTGGTGHRHHGSDKKPLITQPQPPYTANKEDSKRFVSQKTTVDQPDEPRRGEDPVVSGSSAGKVMTVVAHGSGKIHPSAGRGQQRPPPPPLLETREDLDEDEEEEEEENGVSGVGGVNIGHREEIREEDEQDVDEDLTEQETTLIVIDGKPLSIEEDNIERLIQNKSDISGIIRVSDSLEEEMAEGLLGVPRRTGGALPTDNATHGDSTAIVVGSSTALATTTITTIMPPTTLTTTTATATTPPTSATATVQENGATTHHRSHHHQHEHHTTLKAAAATTTTTTTTTSTTSTSTTTTTVATTTAAADLLKPNYDDASKRLKYFDIGKALTLGCDVTQDGLELSWSKDGTNVSEVESLKGRFNLIPAERKFIITRTLESDAGVYTCSVHKLNESRNINVVANVLVKFESTEVGKTNIVEGEKLSLHCIAYGSKPKITWIIGNNTYNASKDRIVLQEDDRGIENALLTIESITLDDYAEFTCEGRNNATDITGKPAMVTMTVRVRGKYAALYVFVGIIAEVVVLCAIILICEKRRNKTEIEESDTDQSPDQRRRKSSRNYN